MKNNILSALLTFCCFIILGCSTSIPASQSGEIDQGYGTIDNKKNTTAISQIEIDEDQPSNITWIDLLQRNSGVTVTGSGNNLSIQIRGKKSMTADHEPLFVLDGRPLGNGFHNISFVDPNMVHRISILKDAAAASTYGSRGADGVILVTLK